MPHVACRLACLPNTQVGLIALWTLQRRPIIDWSFGFCYAPVFLSPLDIPFAALLPHRAIRCCSRGQSRLVSGTKDGGSPKCDLCARAPLLDKWSDWFNKNWECAIPLRQQSARIPALAPARGTVEATEMWRAYERSCEQAIVQLELSAYEAVEDGQSEAERKDGHRSPTKELGLRRLDPLNALARLYRLGKLVLIDESSRQAPLHVPVTAELFGIPSLKTVGSVSYARCGSG